MTELHVNYYFKSNEERDEFYKEILASGGDKASRAEEGNIRYDYFIPAGEDCRMFLLEQWKDQEVLDIHMKTDHFAKIMEIGGKYAYETKITQYEGLKEKK